MLFDVNRNILYFILHKYSEKIIDNKYFFKCILPTNAYTYIIDESYNVWFVLHDNLE